jgi:hypothetical protein
LKIPQPPRKSTMKRSIIKGETQSRRRRHLVACRHVVSFFIYHFVLVSIKDIVNLFSGGKTTSTRGKKVNLSLNTVSNFLEHFRRRLSPSALQQGFKCLFDRVAFVGLSVKLQMPTRHMFEVYFTSWERFIVCLSFNCRVGLDIDTEISWFLCAFSYFACCS